MDLPDCPPGAEGYQDSVTEVPKKLEDSSCTKAEQEFQEHLNSLKIKLEDGTTRPMVERSGRDVSGKWIYLCYPCAAMCSGESILQTHISGKKHKNKLALTNVWPLSIFEEHPYNQHNVKTGATEKVLQKMAQEVDIHNQNVSELDKMFGKYKEVTCHIQESLDSVKAPLIGLEYLIEHPPEKEHYEPKYICTLCSKQGHPRTIINHMTCFWHRYNYILRHFPKACNLLTPYRSQTKYREGVGIVINRLVQRIEDKYGRKRPVNIEKEEYEKDKDLIHQWIFKAGHFAEREGCTFEEVVDIGLIDSLHQNDSGNKQERGLKRKEPSPPIVAAPAKPHFNHFSRPAGRQERRAGSIESLSDISDDLDAELRGDAVRTDHSRERGDRSVSPYRSRFALRNNAPIARGSLDKIRAPNYEYKIKLASDKRAAAEEFARKTLAYHEKNPEKHPLYPEEWKKFWNRRYKEIQAEGKDPSKHDFKPEWIVFWTERMKVLHDEELRVTVNEIYRKMCLSPPDMTRPSPDPARRVLDPDRRRSPFDKRRRSPDLRHREADLRRRESDLRRRSPDLRRRSPGIRHRSPMRRRSPDFRRDRRSPMRRSPGRRRSSERRRSPVLRRTRSRSRSPMRRHSPSRGRMSLESGRRSRSPLSQREMQARNRSPEHVRDTAPCMQTVLISDDELKPDDDLSPWNSDNEIGSVVSVRSARSARSAESRRRGAGAGAAAAPDDVVATLRLLVALEDYLGSLGPKLVDLLAEALKMEKEKANSSEELLVRESAVVLIETAKEKLKGAAQAGLVAGSAAAAARAAVVRAAATLHEADKRARQRRKRNDTKSSSGGTSNSAVPVAGIGEVDRAQIAQQMAEALIAQGKTDVSSEELAQLVEAVVGMAEAKKREAERRQTDTRPTIKPSQPQKSSGTASALQMLQSAYDENDKKLEKEDAPDAMDGLSDSDLETLLKNFNELSAEEQHSLIAYLKKLEAREPARVERLRQYVSDAAAAPAPAAGPPAAPAAGPPATPAPGPPAGPPAAPAAGPPAAPAAHAAHAAHAALVIDSDDDDDYTVEEVFQSATQKVKEDQMRQEMEIVKKSLEESKPSTPNLSAESVAATSLSSIVDITRNLSSASDLFALVQASIKSTAASTPAPLIHAPDVVVSNTHPRSFGDLPESSTITQEQAKTGNASLISMLPTMNNQPPPLLRTPLLNIMDNRNRQPSPSFNPGNQPPNEHYNQGNHQNDRFNPGNQPPNEHFNQGNHHPNDRFNPGGQPPNEHFNQSGQLPNDRFLLGNPSSLERFNQGNQPPNDRFNQGNQPPNDRFGILNPPPNERVGQVNQPPHDHFNQGNQLLLDRFNPSIPPGHDHFNPGGQPPVDHFNQGNQWNVRPNVPLENRTPSIRPLLGVSENFVPAQYNQGPRPNFMNARGQDNFENRLPLLSQPQFPNSNQNNFRGRGGRGHYGGRGRGRGYY